MTPELASFSDWTLALLPRLFLYPGGLWLLAMVLALRFIRGGPGLISSRALFADLSRVNLLSISLGWVALALTPFPGASSLSSPVDSLTLVALLALSILLDAAGDGDSSQAHRRAETGLWAAAAITLAISLPAIESGSLLVQAGSSALLLTVSSLAVAAGLLALAWDGNAGLADQVRRLAWFCLGVVPLWQRLTGDNPLVASLFVLAGVGMLGMRNYESFVGRRSSVVGRRRLRYSAFQIPHSAFPTAIAWLLALLGLLWALLAAA